MCVFEWYSPPSASVSEWYNDRVSWVSGKEWSNRSPFDVTMNPKDQTIAILYPSRGGVVGLIFIFASLDPYKICEIRFVQYNITRRVVISICSV